MSTSTWTFAYALASGPAGERELEDMADAWRQWSADPDGLFVMTHGEVLAR